jgi:8-oxo-dGTP diphosphatase
MDIKLKLREALLEHEKMKVAAGVLIKCIETNRIFLLQRNENGGKMHGVWSVMSGGIENGETIINGLRREIVEELSINPNIINYNFIGVEKSPDSKIEFHYYEGFTNSEFIPKLDHENLDYGWFSIDDVPSPLYPKMITKLNNIWKNDKI